jgi:hypothetical protein
VTKLRRAALAALAAAAAVRLLPLACFYDFDEPLPARDAGPKASSDTPPPPPPPVPTADARVPIEAAAPSCPVQDVTWQVDGSTCSAPSSSILAPEGSQILTDSTPPETGSTTITCTKGHLVPSSSVCEPPRVFDVDSPSGCVNGYCQGSGAGCGVPEPSFAKQFCIAQGYADETDFSTAAGPNNQRQCTAGGVSCFNNLNGNCNLILASVSCRH